MQRIFWEDEDPRGSADIVALYMTDDRIMFLPLDWSADDLRDVSTLLHELTHHMQTVAGIEYPCRGAMERVAYDAQIAFLEAAGIDFFAEFETNPLFLAMITTCGIGE